MRRREFLKALVATAVAPSLIPRTREIRPEYPFGTRKVLADGSVFRYCQAAASVNKGDLCEINGIIGVSAGYGWIQTYGPCIVNCTKNSDYMVGLKGGKGEKKLVNLVC